MNTPTSQTAAKPGESDVDLTPAPLRLSAKSSALENNPAPETRCGPIQAQEEDLPSPIHSTPVSEAVDSVIDPLSRDSPVSFREKARSLAALVSKFEILDAVNNTDTRHGRTGRRLLRKPHSPSPGRAGRKRPEETPTTPPLEEKVEDVVQGSGDVSPGHDIAPQTDFHDQESPARDNISSAGQHHIQSSTEGIDLADSVMNIAHIDAAKPQGRLSGGLVAERMMLFEPSRGNGTKKSPRKICADHTQTHPTSSDRPLPSLNSKTHSLSLSNLPRLSPDPRHGEASQRTEDLRPRLEPKVKNKDLGLPWSRPKSIQSAMRTYRARSRTKGDQMSRIYEDHSRREQKFSK
jgi:hypothetical protein